MTLAGTVTDGVKGAGSTLTAGLPVNAMAALLLAGYLIAVMVRGNMVALGHELYTDLFGPHPFWRWAVAFIILAALADFPSTQRFFGPLFIMSLVAMLIMQAEQGRLGTLNSSIRSFFGYGQQSQSATS